MIDILHILQNQGWICTSISFLIEKKNEVSKTYLKVGQKKKSMEVTTELNFIPRKNTINLAWKTLTYQYFPAS